MSSREGSRKSFNPSKLAPPPQSQDVYMRGVLSDNESETVESAEPTVQESSDRRRKFDPSKLGKPNVVVTYSLPSTQVLGSSKSPVSASRPATVGTTSSPQPANNGPGSIPSVSEAPYPVQPLTFENLPNPDFRSLQSVDAVLVSSNFLRHHIKDLVWIKACLVKFDSHVVRCRNLTMKNLNSIERAIYAENRVQKLESYFEQRNGPD